MPNDREQNIKCPETEEQKKSNFKNSCFFKKLKDNIDQKI